MHLFHPVLNDLRYGLRAMRKDPGFTVIAVFTLAIGIGVNSTIFSFADAHLLRPLPISNPDRVVTIRSSSPTAPLSNISYPDYVDLINTNKTFESIAAGMNSPFGFSAGPGSVPKMKVGMFVSGNFFRVFGVEPVLGRGFRPDEDSVPDRDAVVVLSDGLWKSEFNSDRSVIGRKLWLNGVAFTVIGVAPEQFTGIDLFLRPALYVPLAMTARLGPKDLLTSRTFRALTVKGRLKPGVAIEQARADMASIAQFFQRTYPLTNRNQNISVLTELSVRMERYPPDTSLIEMLMALAGCVLLVACANCAGLMLSRGRARSREIAVRIALGSSRTQLVQQLLVESLLIGVAGGLLGALISYAGVAFLARIDAPTDFPQAVSIAVDRRVLTFTFVTSFLSAVLFGLAPALQTSRPTLVPALKAADPDRAGVTRVWGRNLLVISQVAVSLILVTVTGLLVSGVSRQLAAGPRFRTDHLVMMSLDPSLVYYTPSQTEKFFVQLMQRVRATPGVRSAALTRVMPAAPSQIAETVVPEGYQFPKGTDAAYLYANTVDENYFDTMKIGIVRGRGFLKTDTASAPRVAVVNEEFAKTYWPAQAAIGKRFRINGPGGPWVQVVGVAETSKYLWIGEAPIKFLYLPLAQHPQPRMTLIVESQGASSGLVPQIRQVIHDTDPIQPVYDVRTMEDFYEQRVVRAPSMIVQSVASMAATGLFLAMIGLYGLMAHSVALRTREIGLRMALGANQASVLLLILKQGFFLMLPGILIGLVGSLGAKQIASLIFGPLEVDARVYVLTPVALIVISLLAAYLPAKRASRVDPLRALHDE